LFEGISIQSLRIAEEALRNKIGSLVTSLERLVMERSDENGPM
jgi:hypothetical protein